MKMPEVKNMVAGYMAAVERAVCGTVYAGQWRDDCLQNENFLVIDYREKTLDIAWVSVGSEEKTWQADRGAQFKTAPSQVKVHLIKSSAVDKEDTRICTRMAYVQAVLYEALRRHGMNTDENFCKAAQTLDDCLTRYEQQIWDTFYIYGAEDLKDLAVQTLTVVPYKQTEISISFDLLAIVYHQKMDEWMTHTLNDVKNKIKAFTKDENFKIIFMGGFGRFALVRQQAARCFKLTEYDCRAVVLDEQQQAMAEVMAAEKRKQGRIKVCFNAPVGLGVYSYDQTGRPRPWYAINLGQEILEGCPYYIQSMVDHEYFLMFSYSGNISSFLIHGKGRDLGPGLGILSPEYAKSLTGIIRSATHTAMLGFSVSHTGVISLHIRNFNVIAKKAEGTVQTVAFAGTGKLFEKIQCWDMDGAVKVYDF